MDVRILGSVPDRLVCIRFLFSSVPVFVPVLAFKIYIGTEIFLVLVLVFWFMKFRK